MTERVSDEVLRRWVRTLTPGQAALCEELLELRAKVRHAEALVRTLRESRPLLHEGDWSVAVVTRWCAVRLSKALGLDDG